MDHEAQRRNSAYVQAVLDAGVPLAAAHVATAAAGSLRRYWVLDQDGKTLEPSVPESDLAPAGGSRTTNPAGLTGLYSSLLAFHRRAANGDLQRELRYRPAPVRRKVVMHPAHTAFLREAEDRERDEDLSR